MMRNLFAIAVCLVICSTASWGQTPIVVDLTAFDTEYNESTYVMDITWETASESDVAGFNLYRSTSLGTLGDKLNASLMIAQGSSTIGANYEFTDEPATSGRYYYQLAEVSLSTGNEAYFRPSEYPEGDTEPDWDDFIKVYEDQESVVGGEYFWFNEGEEDPGDGRKLSIIVTTTGVSGSITVKQTNAEPENAPNAEVCPWRWELTSDVGAQASNDFFYNPDDISGTPENSDYIGIAQYNASTVTWTWSGGSVYSGDHKVRLDDEYPEGYFVLYRRIFGDISGDGYVDLDDYQKFGDVWNATSNGEFPEGSDARFFNYSKTTTDGKQIIDLDDFQVFGDNWNNGTPK